MTVDLPARLLADRLTWALAVCCAVAIEFTLARHPGLPPGGGVAAGVFLLLWQWLRLRRRPHQVAIGPDGVGVHLSGVALPVPARGSRSRVVGRTIFLHWRGADGAGTLWLTPADLPRDALRAARVSLHAGRAAATR